MVDPDGGLFRYCEDCISVVRNQMRRSGYLDDEADDDSRDRYAEAEAMLDPDPDDTWNAGSPANPYTETHAGLEQLRRLAESTGP